MLGAFCHFDIIILLKSNSDLLSQLAIILTKTMAPVPKLWHQSHYCDTGANFLGQFKSFFKHHHRITISNNSPLKIR